MRKSLVLFVLVFILMFTVVFKVDALSVSDESELRNCLTTGDDIQCVLASDIELSAPIVSLEGKEIDLNGNTLKGDVVDVVLNVNNGNYIMSNSFHILGGDGAAYRATIAKLGIYLNGNLAILSGTVELGISMCTTPGQTITIDEGAAFIVPTGKELQLYSLIKNEGSLIVQGTLRQYSSKEGGNLKTSNAILYNSSPESNAAIIGDLTIDGGTYYTWDTVYGYTPMTGKNSAYTTDYAVFNLDETLNIVIEEGNVILGFSMNTMPNQTLTLSEDATFTIPADKVLNIDETTIINVDGVFEVSDIIYFEKINLNNGLFILNSSKNLDEVDELFGDSYCIYEVEENVYAITSEHNDLVLVNEVEATIDNDGYTGDLVCSKCGKVIRTGVIIPKLEEDLDKDDTEDSDSEDKNEYIDNEENTEDSDNEDKNEYIDNEENTENSDSEDKKENIENLDGEEIFENPQTGDNILVNIVIACISLLSLVLVIIYYKKDLIECKNNIN